MSRRYHNRTIITLPKELARGEWWRLDCVYGELWCFGDARIDKNIITFEGESSLCGGEREDEAHIRFVKAFREEFPNCGVETTWIYLEDLPHNTYITELNHDFTILG